MGAYGNTVTYNGVVLFITKMTPVAKPKQIKQRLGKSLAQVDIIGLDAQQFELDVEGVILGTTTANLSTNRANLEALDSNTPYSFTDGMHVGTYIMIPGSLSFDDIGGETVGHYKYSFQLVQE